MRRSQRNVWRRWPSDEEGRISPWVGKALAANLLEVSVLQLSVAVPEMFFNILANDCNDFKCMAYNLNQVVDCRAKVCLPSS